MTRSNKNTNPASKGKSELPEMDINQRAMEELAEFWSVIVPDRDISDVARDYSIWPEKEEFPALAGALNVVSIEKMIAHIRVYRTKSGIRARGKITGHLTQSCVVTLQPVVQKFAEEIDRTFVVSKAAADRVVDKNKAKTDILFEGDDIDAPDIIMNGKIDLAAIALEHFILGLDLYPRAEGVEMEGISNPSSAGGLDDEAAEDDGPVSPFAALAALKLNSDT